MIYTVAVPVENPNLENTRVRGFLFRRNAERFAAKVGSVVVSVPL